jgi:voltage-gated potassium channel
VALAVKNIDPNMFKIDQFIEFLSAAIMFLVTLAFLTALAIVIQYTQTESGLERLLYTRQLIILLIVCWPFFFIERIIYLIFCQHSWKSYVWLVVITLLPPIRLATRRCNQPDFIWLLTWRLINSSLYTKLEKRFLLPILLLSLFMSPFWVTELFFPDKLNNHELLYHLVNLGNALIWELFVIEFIIMFSLAEKKLPYLKKHWLELSIIVLPMLALASILISRYALLKQFNLINPENLLKIERIRRILNIYRTRVVFNRILRIFIVIDVLKRFYQHRNPQKYLTLLQEKLAQQEQEIVKIKQQITQTEQLIKKISHE